MRLHCRAVESVVACGGEGAMVLQGGWGSSTHGAMRHGGTLRVLAYCGAGGYRGVVEDGGVGLALLSMGGDSPMPSVGMLWSCGGCGKEEGEVDGDGCQEEKGNKMIIRLEIKFRV